MKSAAIKSVCDYVLDGTHGSPARVEQGVPVLSAQNIAGGNLIWSTDRHTTTEEFEAFNKRIGLRRGDLLLTIVGTIGRAAIVDEVRPAVFQRSVAILRPDASKIDSRYFYHATQDRNFQDQLKKGANTSAQPGLYLGKLKEVLLPLPPLDDQKRIAKVLDAANSLCAKRRAALNKLDTLAQSIFIEMFGSSSAHHSSVKMQRLGDVSAFENGDRSSNYPSGSDIQDDGVLFLSTRNIRANSLDLTECVFISEEKFASLSRGKARPGDLLITLRGTLGSCCVFEGSYSTAFINAQMMIIRPHPILERKFLHAVDLLGFFGPALV